MLLAIVLVALLLPLIYLLISAGDQKREREKELKRIRRRLAEKGQETQE